jgi:hypothetical protein
MVGDRSGLRALRNRRRDSPVWIWTSRPTAGAVTARRGGEAEAPRDDGGDVTLGGGHALASERLRQGER